MIGTLAENPRKCGHVQKEPEPGSQSPRAAMKIQVQMRAVAMGWEEKEGRKAFLGTVMG